MSIATDTSRARPAPARRWPWSGRSFAKIVQPAPALLILSVLLPVLVLALAGWQNRRDLFKQAELRIQRTLRTLNEHAVKVFETHALVINQINERLRTLDWGKEADRVGLHDMLRDLQANLDQIATITITDAQGRLRASGRTYPTGARVDFADRDWFQALKAGETRLPFVSRSYLGRQSERRVFNIAQRVRSADGGFAGVIAVSVDRMYFERFYRTVEPQPDNVVALVRQDGQLLARQPEVEIAALPAGASFYVGLTKPSGQIFEGVSKLDGVRRLFSYRKVGDYPVYIGFGVSEETLLATWRHNLFVYGVLALAVALALLAMSALAIRQMARERLAVQRWRTAAARLRAEATERERVEAHLRQSQKMEAVGQLTSGIAHDFNNMLGAVIASLDLLRLRLKRQDMFDDAVRRHVENAMEGAWRAASLTQRLLAFSRKQVLSPSPVDVNALVRGMADLIRRTISENVSIVLDLVEESWSTYADANQLENAVLNLVVNARDAMDDGGCLTLTTRNCSFAETDPGGSGMTAGSYVLLAVRDTGSGMPPEVMARAFDPFFTTKAVGKGTGLGLSQVQGFVAQSDGHVRVASDVGRGTTVEIYLPKLAQAVDTAGLQSVPLRSDKETPPASATAPNGPDENLGRTVLVVEDDPQVRRVSTEAFRELGFHVFEASSAEPALQILAQERRIELLFTDVVMPDVNGAQLAEAVRRTRPEVKILFTTGYAEETLVSTFGMDSTFDLIAKPFTLEQLRAKVARVMSRDAVVWW